jgi:hypothetical protein
MKYKNRKKPFPYCRAAKKGLHYHIQGNYRFITTALKKDFEWLDYYILPIIYLAGGMVELLPGIAPAGPAGGMLELLPDIFPAGGLGDILELFISPAGGILALGDILP